MRSTPAASRPVPAPTHSASAWPARRASSSDAAEVLPMPISPSSSALPGSCSTIARPLAMACAHCAGSHRRAGRRIGRAGRDLADDKAVARREVARARRSPPPSTPGHAGAPARSRPRRPRGSSRPSARSRRSDTPTRRAPPVRDRRQRPRSCGCSSCGVFGAQDQAELQRQRFEPSERAERLGLVGRACAAGAAARAASVDVMVVCIGCHSGLDGEFRLSMVRISGSSPRCTPGAKVASR